jgi:hypothetical protein
MADIFISYSKEDRDQALKLSSALEAEGWSVWWDKSLNAGDLYRDEIMTELAKARAVISIWTENSIHSDWVRAEAGRAKAEGKLIPVKVSGIDYDKLPLPFGEMHTENIDQLQLIKAAISSLLSRPAIEPSPSWLTSRVIRHQAIIWMGIVGSAITLFSGLSTLLQLADWAHWIVNHWHLWTHGVWSWLLAYFQIQVPEYLSQVLTLIFFTGMMAFSVHRSSTTKPTRKNPLRWLETVLPTARLTHQVVTAVSSPAPVPALQVSGRIYSIRNIFTLLLFTCCLAVFAAANTSFMSHASGNPSILTGPLKDILNYHTDSSSEILAVLLIPYSIDWFIFILPISAYICAVSRRPFLLVMINMTLYSICGIIVAVSPMIQGIHTNIPFLFIHFAGYLCLFTVLGMLMVMYTPAHGLFKRLASIMMGLLLVLGMNQLSILHRSTYLSASK